MKKVMLVLLVVVFMVGCLDSGYKHTVKYDPKTGNKLSEEWVLDYGKAMQTSTITDANLIISDGSGVSFSKSAFIYDGNDWVKIGEGVKTSGWSPMPFSWPK
ncbi:MAG: hypothetical protein WC356_02855 [Candidatus Micrarchaeia archaeon]|jgi:hypothetical protein